MGRLTRPAVVGARRPGSAKVQKIRRKRQPPGTIKGYHLGYSIPAATEGYCAMAVQQSYDPNEMDAHASRTLQNADQMMTAFNSVKAGIENLMATGAWHDASVQKAHDQITQMAPGMKNLHETLQNHAQITRQQAASARQLSVDIH